MRAELSHQSGQQDAPRELVAGRYELVARLARGGMGEVYSAHDRSTSRRVALKRLLADVQTQRGQAVHFMREYHALSELRHPRIIEVYDYGVDNKGPYYTMELLDGADLRDLSPLPYREACLYLRDVASSLALLHARRLLHRDVSPRNVRRTSDGHCKLLDFGAMIAFGVPPNVTGTPPCIAPEALHGASLDQRSDLYSLGALAYWLLTGSHGYNVQQLDQLANAWAKPLRRPSREVQLPDQLDELVMSLMNLDPMKRPKSAGEVIDWLSAIGELPPDDVPGVARSFFTSTQLCGRSPQSEELAQHIKRAAQGRGGAVIVEGKLGTGKSRLLAEASLIAQTHGLVAVHASARRQGGSGRMLAQELVLSLLRVMPVEAEIAGAMRIPWPRVEGANLGPVAARQDPSDRRVRLQQALANVFGEVARSRPILLSVDDIDRADDASAALIVSLSHLARGLPLLIVASRTTAPGTRRNTAPLSDVLKSITTRVRVSDLSRDESRSLVSSMFGNVPNIELVNDWLFRTARGNPKLTLELAEHLFKRGLVRYVDGTWVVPSEEIELPMPQDLTAAWGLRLEGLSAAALGLAELITLWRGSVSAELCLSACGGASEIVFDSLDELVRTGVLESAGSDYVFAQETVRNVLRERLSPERRSELHERWAEALLREATNDPEVRLEAGWHLLHTRDELRGAQLAAEIAPTFVEQGIGIAGAIPVLEKGLEVYERLGSPLEVRLRMRSALVLAGYLFDYRLAFRYGDETVALLYEVSGMALAQRLARYVGKHMALVLAFVCTGLTRYLLPKARRGPPVVTAVRYLIRAVMGLIGVRATSMDGPGAAAMFEKLAPLSVAPMGAVRLVYMMCKTLTVQMFGHETEFRRVSEQALRLARQGPPAMMSDVEHRWLLVGLLTAMGVCNSSCEGAEALSIADLLESLDTPLARAGALRIRMIYYARRGDSDRAESYRREVQLQAVQGGTVWQGEWFSIPMEGLAGAAWTDLVALRRSLNQLERLVEEVPGFAPIAEGITISYHFRRGEYARAAMLGERYVAAHPPHSLVGWAATYGLIALSWIELGQAQRALELCEASLAQIDPGNFSYFALYAPLEVAHATAIAVLGDVQRGYQILQARIERLRAHGEHASLVNLYQYQARMARLVGDNAGLRHALTAMREAALASGLPAVILLADRVAELRAERRSSPRPPKPGPRVEEPPAKRKVEANESTAMTQFLQRTRSGRRRSGSVLWFLARYLDSEAVYLYGVKPEGLRLMASVPKDSEVPQLTRELSERWARGIEQRFQVSVTLDAVDEGAEPEEQRYRVLRLSATGDAQSSIGAVAIREGSETQREVSSAILADIAGLLSQDIQIGDAGEAGPDA